MSQSPKASLPALLAIGVCLACLIAILISFTRYVWLHRMGGSRALYLRDFEKFSSKAEALNAETIQVHKDIRQDYQENMTDTETKLASFELIAEADEWDTTIRIALAAWGDMLHPSASKGTSDVENGKGDEKQVKLARNHRKYVIGIMRTKCIEAMERRGELSPQLQAMQLCALARATHHVDVKNSPFTSEKDDQTIKFSAFFVPEFDFQAKLDALEPSSITEQKTSARNVLQRDSPHTTTTPAIKVPVSFLTVPSSTATSPGKMKMKATVDELYFTHQDID